MRRATQQTSFYRKLLTYEATWRQNTHRTSFGIHRFRVLAITTSLARLHRMVEVCQKLERGHGLFLFTDMISLRAQDDLLTLPWQTVHQESPESLLAGLAV